MGRDFARPQGTKMGQEIFRVMRDGSRMEQDKILWDKGEDPILRTHPTPSHCHPYNPAAIPAY